jgi:hypothetical protein
VPLVYVLRDCRVEHRAAPRHPAGLAGANPFAADSVAGSLIPKRNSARQHAADLIRSIDDLPLLNHAPRAKALAR